MQKRLTHILLFIVGFILFTFSIELPSLGYKNIDYIEETSNYLVTDYSWYGKSTNQAVFNGDAEELLEIFQKQRRIQNMQATIIFFTLISLTLLFIREKLLYIYTFIAITIVIILVDIAMVNNLI